ncbi:MULTISPECIES: S1C family serine protease [unclassified Oceanispirochaeta]|uniref:S1C family serine protease n=1 Tax=unclassified Oceanispirochaeta TaxID=2635722 RepID=UPI000E093230|nr:MULTISPECIES: trypsin-like peptidase domain-containing protein [unclassified Oceanispirochaeta]MBF9018106.1 trypsin-like peptidase domain-containing protein [Oceanispirochaeta sp. M2]NPD74570.1 PDZ domain-containing protein [Oceanispirochaeta sp. M1]RDG29600.1 PDZ domain-containing protein [Oceanispirochaeta sp. M1]
MINKILKIFFIGMMAVLLFSCATADSSGSMEDRSEAYDSGSRASQQIDSLMEDERPSEALQWIYHYRGSEHPPELDYANLEEQALKEMDKQLKQSMDDREYMKALSLYSSLDAVGQTSYIRRDYDEQNIKLEYIKNLLEFEMAGAAAVMVVQGFVSLEDVSDKDLQYFEERFTKGENRKALAKVVKELGNRSLAAQVLSEEFLSASIRMEDLLEGTVTVWVDKGLRLDRGVGYPDRSIGSGFFIDKKGYILTNYHVIESEVNPEYKGYSRLFIKLSDDRGEKIPARVVGWDRHFDIALLKTEIEAPYVFSFAGIDQFSLGEKIFAIGSPGGLNNTITSGSVSAVRRPLQTMGESIQVDVPINPGNSGGPLMNSDSEVNGIVFAGITGFEGVNFAIDGEYVKTLLPHLYGGGAIKHSWIGVGGYQAYDHLETLYVTPGSPADSLGLARGDIILSINGKKVQRNQDVRDAILGLAPGTIITMDWETTEGIKKHSRVTLAERPDVPLKEAVNADTRENLIPPMFGMVLSQVAKQQYTVEKVYTGGGADEASISANDVIVLRKWTVNEKDGYVLMQFVFKGIKAGYLESAVQLGAGLESAIFF